MGPFDPDLVIVFGTVGALGFTFLIGLYRLKKKELQVQGGDPELGPVVDALRDDLNDTLAQLADMQERLDFTERLLTARRASQEERSG